MKQFEQLEIPVIKQPCEFLKTQLAGHFGSRVKSLSTLKPEKKGHCVWCGTSFASKGLSEHHARRWCGSDCISSAQLLCYPQAPEAKMIRLIVFQHCACARCGTDYSDEIRIRIAQAYARHVKWNGKPGRKVTLHQLGYGTGDVWQTDHIVPIHKGGHGIDGGNLQVLCVSCHKKKTAEDLK